MPKNTKRVISSLMHKARGLETESRKLAREIEMIKITIKLFEDEPNSREEVARETK